MIRRCDATERLREINLLRTIKINSPFKREEKKSGE